MPCTLLTSLENILPFVSATLELLLLFKKRINKTRQCTNLWNLYDIYLKFHCVVGLYLYVLSNNNDNDII